MSNQRLFSGYNRTDRIRLPDDKVKLDPKSVLGASTIATVIKAQKTGDYENVGNALQIHDACSVMDSNVTGPTIIGREEVTVLRDADGVEHELTNPKTIEVYCANGCKIIATKVVELTV